MQLSLNQPTLVNTAKFAQKAAVHAIPELSLVPRALETMKGRIHWAGQREFAELSPNDPSYSHLGTFGLSPCKGLVLVEPNSGNAKLAHIDVQTTLMSIGAMCNRLGRQLDGYLIGILDNELAALAELVQANGVTLRGRQLVREGDSANVIFNVNSQEFCSVKLDKSEGKRIQAVMSRSIRRGGVYIEGSQHIALAPRP